MSQTDMDVRGSARADMEGGGDHDGESSAADMDGMLRQQTAKTLWLLSLVAFLGAWLIFAPATFGYGDPG